MLFDVLDKSTSLAAFLGTYPLSLLFSYRETSRLIFRV